MELLKQLMIHAEQAEIVEIKNEATKIQFEANQLKASVIEESHVTAVRVIRDGRLGFAASTDQKSLDRLCANALESAAYGEAISLKFPGTNGSPSVQVYDRRIAEMPIPRLVEIGREIIDTILQIEPEARLVVSIQRLIQQTKIQNSTGLNTEFTRSPFTIDLEIDRINGDDVLILFDQWAKTTWSEDYLDFVHQLGKDLEAAKKPADTTSKTMPVLFSPKGALVLFLPLMQAINGKNVFQGISPLAGKTGEALFDAKISLVDDGALDGQINSAPYDDEGVTHRPISVIEKGVLQGFLYDLKTATQAGVQSTGNGARSLFNPPSPQATNLLLAAGNKSYPEMLASIDEGVLIVDVLGMGQGNIISGAFSNPISLAYMIEKGEITGRVKDISIAGNIYDLLKDVTAVSQERQWVYGQFYAPYLLLPEMNIIAKG